MKLFITSSPCDDNVPHGVKLPCILFEKNHFVANLKKDWKPQSHVLIITAFPDNDPANDEMRDTFEKAFNYHGLTCSMKLLDYRSIQHTDALLHWCNGIILGGGHVPTQLKYFKELNLRKKLASWKGDFIMGISAGSMNMADLVYVQPEEAGEAIDSDFVRFAPGLGLTKTNILPHYQKVRHYMLDGMRLFEDITYKDSYGHMFYALPDSSYVMCEDGRETIYGESYAICNGRLTKISNDEETVIL